MRDRAPTKWNPFPSVVTMLDLLPGEARKRLRVAMFVAVVAAAAEVISVSAVLPFLAVAVQEGAVDWNPLLRSFYQWTGLSLQQFRMFLGGLVLALVVIANALGSFSKWFQARFVWHAQTDLTVRVMTEHLAHPYPHYLEVNTASYRRDVLDEAGRACQGVLAAAITIARATFIAVGILAVLLFFRPVMSLAVAGVLGGAYALIYVGLRGPLHRQGRRSTEANQVRHQIGQEAFGSIKEVKFYGVEPTLVHAILGPSRRHFRAQGIILLMGQIPFHVLQIVAFGGLMVVFLVLLAGLESLSSIIPSLGFFAFAGYRLLPALQEGFQGYSKMRGAAPIAERLALILDEPSHLPTPPRGERLHLRKVLSVQDVSFRYPDADDTALRRITLDVPASKTAALVGPSGSGKTTLLDLLLGLLEPTEGSIRVDGTPLDAQTAPKWRNSIGYVPQEVTLHDATVKENIAFGVPPEHIDMERVHAAAKQAHMHAFIGSSLPKGYDTRVGERGIRLSGGQRQRLGIARALYRDPDVLVLDEATSNLDNQTESRIAEAIQELGGTKTILIVAHRLTTVQDADRIFVLDEGVVVSQGTYEELLESDPHFRALARVGGS